MARVTIISLSPLDRDARVLRQIRYLQREHVVTVVAPGNATGAGPGVTVRQLPAAAGFVTRNARALPRLLLGRIARARGFDAWYWGRADHLRALELVRATPADVIVANNWDGLPIAARAADSSGAKILLDLHEYAPTHWNNRAAWRLLVGPMIDHCLRRYTPRISACVTVGSVIAERYTAEYGLRPTVVMNAPDLAQAPTFRATDDKRIRLIHHGLPTPERRLEVMIDAVARSDARWVLHFMLVPGNPRYERELRALADRVAPGRVFFETPVAPDEIVPTIARYDMGIFVLPPTTYNYHAAMPNKLFDFIGAGLAVCVGPSPEMARLVQRFGLGVVAESFDPAATARVLDRLTPPDIDAMKRRSIEASAQVNAKIEMEKLAEIVRRLAQP